MKEILLQGSYYEIGVQHGQLLKNDIQEFLNRDLAEINLLKNKAIPRNQIPDVTSPYKECIFKYLPHIAEELEGLAKGAQISIEEAVLLQIRRELIGIEGFTLLGDCSSFGLFKEQETVVGQTIDLPGNMADLGNVFKIVYTSSNYPSVLMYSFSGLLGYLGMNELGVAVGINLVISDNWKTGIPPYLLVRALLNCKNIEECIEVIKNTPIASSRSFIISDKEKLIIVELTPDDFKIIEGNTLTHTNHYLHPELLSKDKVNIFSKNSSIKRLKILDETIKKSHGKITAIKEVFSEHSLYPVGMCAHNESNPKWPETVAAVMMYPLKGQFEVLKGKPCESDYTLFNLKDESTIYY